MERHDWIRGLPCWFGARHHVRSAGECRQGDVKRCQKMAGICQVGSDVMSGPVHQSEESGPPTSGDPTAVA